MDTLLRPDSRPAQPTLLLVDESTTVQRVIALTFVDEGIRVVAVSDGAQAIKLIDQDPPDIVLADVGIRGSNGYDVARHIKDHSHLGHIPVLLSAGAYEPVDQARATAVGCAGVLAKPFEPQRVIERVKELLAPARRRAPSLDGGLGAPAAAPWSAFAELPLVQGVKSEAAGDIDDYFDRLDKAFALLSDASTVSEAATSPTKSGAHWSGRPQAPEAEETDRPASRPSSPPVLPALDALLRDDGPVGVFKPEVDPNVATAAPRVPEPRVAEPPVPPPPEWTFVPARVVEPPRSPNTALPPLADAFAALLAAERSEHDGLAGWPSSSALSGPSPDDLVEQVARRVLERVSDRVVRESVDATVSATAERLIRDEIERIKAHIT